MSSTLYNEIIQITKSLQPRIEIKVSNFLPDDIIQAKRHKRKSSRRWQKKWLKRFGTKSVPSTRIVKIGNMLIMSPERKKALDKVMDRLNKKIVSQHTIAFEQTMQDALFGSKSASD